VELNCKLGFIDNTGKEIVPPKYRFIKGLKANGLLKVKYYNRRGKAFLDNTGKEVGKK